jgi:hypothetical protein
MKTGFENLNLRPFERRLVVVVGVVMFIVLNFWFVVPHFSDWGKVQFRRAKAERTLQAFESEVRQIPIYQARVRELGSENSNIPIEEQALHFANTRESVAGQAGVTIANASKINTRTNQFFQELTQTITLLCKEQELVNFLYSLGSGNSLIRVRDLSLRPDAPRQQLNASVKLAASYQKRPAVKAGAPSAQPSGAAPRPKATATQPATTSIPARSAPAGTTTAAQTSKQP